MGLPEIFSPLAIVPGQRNLGKSHKSIYATRQAPFLFASLLLARSIDVLVTCQFDKCQVPSRCRRSCPVFARYCIRSLHLCECCRRSEQPQALEQRVAQELTGPYTKQRLSTSTFSPMTRHPARSGIYAFKKIIIWAWIVSFLTAILAGNRHARYQHPLHSYCVL